MTFNKPISRTELLNTFQEDWHECSSEDPYQASLVSAPIPNADSPPPVRPPPQTIAATNTDSASTYGLIRDRKTAALLIGLLR